MLFEENKLMMVFEALKAENTYISWHPKSKFQKNPISELIL